MCVARKREGPPSPVTLSPAPTAKGTRGGRATQTVLHYLLDAEGFRLMTPAAHGPALARSGDDGPARRGRSESRQRGRTGGGHRALLSRPGPIGNLEKQRGDPTHRATVVPFREARIRLGESLNWGRGDRRREQLGPTGEGGHARAHQPIPCKEPQDRPGIGSVCGRRGDSGRGGRDCRGVGRSRSDPRRRWEASPRTKPYRFGSRRRSPVHRLRSDGRRRSHAGKRAHASRG